MLTFHVLLTTVEKVRDLRMHVSARMFILDESINN